MFFELLPVNGISTAITLRCLDIYGRRSVTLSSRQSATVLNDAQVLFVLPARAGHELPLDAIAVIVFGFQPGKHNADSRKDDSCNGCS